MEIKLEERIINNNKEVETTKEVVKNQGRTGFNQGIKGWKAR